MEPTPCPGPCNNRARRAWKDYETAWAAWEKAYDAHAAALEAGKDAGDPPEPPAEPTNTVVQGDPVFCHTDNTRIRAALGELDQLAGQLQADIDGQRGAPGTEQEKTGKRGKASTTQSVDPRVDDLDELYRALAKIEDEWRAFRGYAPRPYMGDAGEQPLHAGANPRNKTIGFLVDEAPAMLLHPGCVKFGLGVLAWQRLLQGATHSQPIPVRRPGRCPECKTTGTLFRRADGFTECRKPGCPRVLSEDDYEATVATEPRATPAEPDLQEAS